MQNIISNATGMVGRGGAKITVRSGLSFARGLTIDPYISQEDAKVLYERWKKEWGEPVDCGGGIFAITCEMVMQVPITALVSTYSEKRAKRLVSAAQNYAVV